MLSGQYLFSFCSYKPVMLHKETGLYAPERLDRFHSGRI